MDQVPALRLSDLLCSVLTLCLRLCELLSDERNKWP